MAEGNELISNKRRFCCAVNTINTDGLANNSDKIIDGCNFLDPGLAIWILDRRPANRSTMYQAFCDILRINDDIATKRSDLGLIAALAYTFRDVLENVIRVLDAFRKPAFIFWITSAIQEEISDCLERSSSHPKNIPVDTINTSLCPLNGFLI